MTAVLLRCAGPPGPGPGLDTPKGRGRTRSRAGLCSEQGRVRTRSRAGAVPTGRAGRAAGHRTRHGGSTGWPGVSIVVAGAEKLTAADGERQMEMGFAMASATQRGAPAGRPVIFDSPVGWLGVAVSPAGLRRVLLPNSAGRAGRVSPLLRPDAAGGPGRPDAATAAAPRPERTRRAGPTRRPGRTQLAGRARTAPPGRTRLAGRARRAAVAADSADP